jgi:hypothetical protein
MAKRIVKKDNKSKVKDELLELDKTDKVEKNVKKKGNNDKIRKQENIFLLVLVLILIGCFVAIGLLFYKYFYAGASSNKYGDRLDGISNYPLPSTLEADIKSLYTDEKMVDSVKVNVEGKIIYITIGFKESVKVETAQSQAAKSLEKIGEENLKFYDVQFILKYVGTEENENFPIFGSKNSNSLKVVW